MSDTKFTPGPIEVLDLKEHMKDWTGSRFVLRAPEAPGGVALIIGGLGEEEERANADLYAAAPGMHKVLEEIDRLAEAGLCQMTADGKHSFLHDIRRKVAELGIQGGLTEYGS
jgi:hypothetical protein